MSSDALAEESREAIRQGSKSFSAAARLFDRGCREDAYMLYAWCRHCDDVIDEQELGQGKVIRAEPAEARLAKLREQTEAALDNKLVSDPNFAALQRVVQRHDIPRAYPNHLLDGFEMDVDGRRFDSVDDTLEYCYHVAGVVGLMMAHVMGVRDPEILDRACDLGLGFQLTNIARDVMEDAQNGRLYLPQDWLQDAGVPADGVARVEYRSQVFGVVTRLITAAQPYYDSSRWGLPALRPRRAWAIATARRVYGDIGRLVREGGEAGLEQRAVVSRASKMQHLLLGGLEGLSASTAGKLRRPTPRRGLWNRPQAQRPATSQTSS